MILSSSSSWTSISEVWHNMQDLDGLSQTHVDALRQSDSSLIGAMQTDHFVKQIIDYRAHITRTAYARQPTSTSMP
jgi:hypothetical protein